MARELCVRPKRRALLDAKRAVKPQIVIGNQVDYEVAEVFLRTE